MLGQIIRKWNIFKIQIQWVIRISKAVFKCYGLNIREKRSKSRIRNSIEFRVLVRTYALFVVH